jgi:hypothetical protein
MGFKKKNIETEKTEEVTNVELPETPKTKVIGTIG